LRRTNDPRKKDFEPSSIELGPISFYLGRHFGFCYGVENAIEISYKALEENPEKRVFLLSQMIHNPLVNEDLVKRGIRFIMDTDGKQFIDWSELKPDDIVIIPAFGTTLEIEKILQDIGIEIQHYNTTCPFVQKVWNRSYKLGEEKFTILIHGKHNHEETRATFSHSSKAAPALILRDITEARLLSEFISGNRKAAEFYEVFKDRYSEGFSVEKDLLRVGVVNQTTMLATETSEIAEFMKSVMVEKYGEENLKGHFADTRDTLCYATNDNQQSTYSLLETDADLAIVVGGYNSSNTSHLVELCEKKFPTYFINSADEIGSKNEIKHYDYPAREFRKTKNFLPSKKPVKIILTSGASCPDTVVDEVMLKLVSFFHDGKDPRELVEYVLKDL